MTDDPAMTRTQLRDRRGFILPFALIAMAVLAVLCLAGMESAGFGVRAARTQAAAAVALFAADEGLHAFVRSTEPPSETLRLEVPPARVRVTATPLVTLDDGSVVANVVAEAEAWPGTRRALRRALGIVVRVDSAGERRRVAGSWREDL